METPRNNRDYGTEKYEEKVYGRHFFDDEGEFEFNTAEEEVALDEQEKKPTRHYFEKKHQPKPSPMRETSSIDSSIH